MITRFLAVRKIYWIYYLFINYMYELCKNNVLFNLALLSTQQSTPNVTYFTIGHLTSGCICLKTKTYNNFQPLIVPVNTIIQLSLIYPRYDWNWTDTDLHVQTVLHNRDVKLTLCFISSGFFWLTVTILTKDFWVDACSKIEALQTFFFSLSKTEITLENNFSP